MHYTTKSFWDYYKSLPGHIQKLADKNFKLLKSNPHHPSLQFKKIGQMYSVRVGIQYRALGLSKNEKIYWFWIGSHTEYDKIID